MWDERESTAHLVYSATGLPVKEGDKVKVHNWPGEGEVITVGVEGHKVYVQLYRPDGTKGMAQIFFLSVIGAEVRDF